MRPSVDEGVLVERLHKFAKRRRRRGYRLAHRELRRDGFRVNHKRVYRLWKREGLKVPPRRSRKRIRHVAPPRSVTAQHPNAGALWADGASTSLKRARWVDKSYVSCA